MEGPSPEGTRPWQGRPAGEGGTVWGGWSGSSGPARERVWGRGGLLEGCARLCEEAVCPLSPSCCPVHSPPPGQPREPHCCRSRAEGAQNRHMGSRAGPSNTRIHRVALKEAKTHLMRASPRPMSSGTARYWKSHGNLPLKIYLTFCYLTEGRHPYAGGSFLPGPSPLGPRVGKNWAAWHHGAKSCMQGTRMDASPLTHAHTYMPPQQAGPSPAQSLAQLPHKHTTCMYMFRGTNTHVASHTQSLTAGGQGLTYVCRCHFTPRHTEVPPTHTPHGHVDTLRAEGP